MNAETKLQSEIAIAHSQKYPEQYGQLFHISNERSHKNQAFIAKAIGIVPGVSDFIYVSKKHNAATELKISGNRHDVSTIRNQIKWGEVWEQQSKKNHWRMCFTVEQALSCYEGNFKGYTLKQAKKLIKNVKTKTTKITWQENI